MDGMTINHIVSIDHGSYLKTRASTTAGESAQAEPGIQQHHESRLCREHVCSIPSLINIYNMTLICM